MARLTRILVVSQVLLLTAVFFTAGCGRSRGPAGRAGDPSAEEPDPLARYVSSTTKPVTQELGVVFGNKFELVGINVPATVKVGEPIEIEQVWHCLTTPDREWQFALLFDHISPWWRLNHGHHPPVPTTMWGSGQYVSWRVEVTFPPEAPPGRYSINMHPYILVRRGESQEFERLPITQEGTATLGTIELVKSGSRE